jgi:hypothetical protein
MSAKSLLIVGALGIASIGIASAKTYDIRLESPAMVGNTELKAGEYKLKVEGTQVVFTDVQSSRTFTAAVKVANGAQKFGETVVETTQQADMAHIDAIDLAGSSTKLEFGQ